MEGYLLKNSAFLFLINHKLFRYLSSTLHFETGTQNDISGLWVIFLLTFGPF